MSSEPELSSTEAFLLRCLLQPYNSLATAEYAAIHVTEDEAPKAFKPDVARGHNCIMLLIRDIDQLLPKVPAVALKVATRRRHSVCLINYGNRLWRRIKQIRLRTVVSI